MLERLYDGYEELNVIQVDPKRHQAMKVYYVEMRKYWNDLSMNEGYTASKHRNEFENYLDFEDL
jgi:hypothetical protein